MRSTRFAETVIEMGPQWIFAGLNPSDLNDPANIILQLAAQCGLQFRPDPVGSRGQVIYDRTGMNITERVLPIFGRFDGAAATGFVLAARLDEEDPTGSVDFSVEVGLRLGGWIPRSPEEQFVEWIRFDLPIAQPTDTISFRRYFGRDLIPFPFLVTDQRGFAHLPECLAEDFLSPNSSRLHLNTRVATVQWSDECVCATAVENGETRQYCAPYAIHTFSIGSLQFGTVQFEPELPEQKIFAYNQLNMAPFLKIWVLFNETFWDADVDLIFPIMMSWVGSTILSSLH